MYQANIIPARYTKFNQREKFKIDQQKLYCLLMTQHQDLFTD